MYAALQMQHTSAFVPTYRQINTQVRINIHNQLMLLHDQPFDAVPLWVRYNNLARTMEILFEDGYVWPMENDFSDTLHTHVIKSAKITLIRLESNNVVEAWETILLNDTYK